MLGFLAAESISGPRLTSAAFAFQIHTSGIVATFKNSNGPGHGFPPKFDLHKNYAHLLRIFAENRAILDGKALHCRLLKTVPQPHLFLTNSLLNMYLKCGAIQDAHQVFDEIPQPDIVSWNTMIGGHFLSGSRLNAFNLFRNMLACGVAPDHFSFTAVLKGCVGFEDFDSGLQAHCILLKLGVGENAFIGSGLVEFYAYFHHLDESEKVFNNVKFKDTVLINTMIGVVAENNNLNDAFVYFRLILSSSLAPTRASFVNLLSVTDGCDNLRQGMQVHCAVIKFGFDGDGIVENSMVGMYSSWNAMDDAFTLLFHSGSKNVMSWTSLITGYANQGHFQGAMDVFSWLYREVAAFDSILLTCVLCVSAASESLLLGSQVHSVILKLGFELDTCIRDSLMDMYAKCSHVEDTIKIFQEICDHHDLVSWTTVISGYVHNGFSIEALINFSQMHQEGVNPDTVACISALTGCIDLRAIDQGEQIHAYMIKYGGMIDISIQTALLSLYAELGSLDSVLKLFEQIIKHDVVSWTSLISAYAKHGHNHSALVSLTKMLQEGAKPNHFTFATALTACAKLTAYEIGKSIHAHLIKVGFENDKFVGSALIDMYSKCGSMKNAIYYFLASPKHDIVLWNALLSGHAHHGNGLELIRAFNEMHIHGVKPDQVTFLSVLSGCSHSGLVDRVVSYFVLMHDEYGITPTKEHCTSVVDALGRAGLFKETIEFIEGMGFEPGILMLRALLSSCVVHERLQLGIATVAKMLMLGDNDSATYVLLSKLYAVCGRLDDVIKVRKAMDCNCLGGKKVGKSWIEIKS